MGIGTLIRYLIGDRRAILELASSRWTLAVGLVFVLSTGFAREYDGEDLLREPWYLVLPLVASLTASLALFGLGYAGLLSALWRHPDLRGDVEVPSFVSAYGSFLGLFWMTAPLAWLYAVPYERFLSPAEAMRANLWTLALVAAWRVALMVRVFGVLMGYRLLPALCLVMLFADAVALLALFSLPVPLIDVMGGIRYSESERLLRSAAQWVSVLGGCSSLPWLIGAVGALGAGRPRWQGPLNAGAASPRPTPALWGLAAASIVVWGVPLTLTQPAQQLRFRVETYFRQGRVSSALELMSAHSPNDFPPNWDPPPRWGLERPGVGSALVLDAWEEILARPPAPWVREVYLRKLSDLLVGYFVSHPERLARLLDRLPEGPALLAEAEREGSLFLIRQLEPHLRGHGPGRQPAIGNEGDDPPR